MVKFEDDCYGCDWHTCIGCPKRDPVPYVYCDDCGRFIEDAEEAYRPYGSDECYCSTCAWEKQIFDEEGDVIKEWEQFFPYDNLCNH